MQRSLAVSLALCAAVPAAAQSPPDDVIWLTDSVGAGAAIDPFGNVVATARFPAAPLRTPTLPVHRAPDGSLWIADRHLGTVEIYHRDGTPRASVPVTFPVVEIAFDRGGDAWLIDSALVNPSNPATDLWRVAPDGTVRSRRSLLAPATGITADAVDGIVVAQRDPSGGLVTRFHTVTGSVRATNLPPELARPTAIAGTPSGTVLVGGTGVLVELGADLAVRRTVRDASLQPTRIAMRDRQRALLTSSQSGVLGPLLELDLATLALRTVRSDLSSDRVLTVGPRGGVWVYFGASVRRLTPDLARPDLTVVTNRVPTLDAGLRSRALVVAQLEDDDGDGTANGLEVELGTNYLDPQSRPEAALSTPRVTYRQHDQLDFTVRGIGTRAALVLAGGYDLGLPSIPGIAGRPRLDVNTLLPFSLVTGVPGSVSFVVPDDPSLNGVPLCAQAVVGVLEPRFTDHACVNLARGFDRVVRETFDPTNRIQASVSSARADGGQLVPLRVGGSGRLGVFDPSDGRALGNDVWEWSTDDQLVPGSRTLFGSDVRVTDGRFDFQTFTIPAGVTVRFVGSRPLRLSVAGTCRIDGTLDLSGTDVRGDHQGKNSQAGPPIVPGRGQSGTPGGAGAGRGGDGAFGCDGTGNPQRPGFNGFAGFDGEDVQLPAGHAYTGQESGTGGRGGALFPPHGDQTRLVYRGFGGVYAMEAGGSGSGGGFRGPGSDGLVLEAGYVSGNGPNLVDRGPATTGGLALRDLYPVPPVTSSIGYFLVGGSGGGGGGSHPLFAQSSDVVDRVKYRSGAAGAGGGGAIALRVGHELNVTGTGRIVCRGGSCEPTTTQFSVLARGVPAPGGGGSGGSALLQVAGAVQQAGSIDVRGGSGSVVDVNGFFNFDLRGGDGAPGYARLETGDTTPPASTIGNVEPAAVAADLGPLRDRDPRAVALLGPYATPVGAPSEYRHYELETVLDGQRVVFTDDPRRFAPADQSGQPVRIRFRALNSQAQRGPWRDYVTATQADSLGRDGSRQFEVLLEFDTSVVHDVRVDELRVVVRD